MVSSLGNTTSDQMSDHRTNFVGIERLVDKSVDAEINGLFKKGVAPFRNNQQNSRFLGLSQVTEKIFFPNPGCVHTQDITVEGVPVEERTKRLIAVKGHHLVPLSLEAFPQKTPAGKILIDDTYFSHHNNPFRQILCPELRIRGQSMFLLTAILKNHLVDDLTAQNAPPPKEFVLAPIELLIGHGPTTSLASHICTPSNILGCYVRNLHTNRVHHLSAVVSC